MELVRLYWPAMHGEGHNGRAVSSVEECCGGGAAAISITKRTKSMFEVTQDAGWAAFTDL